MSTKVAFLFLSELTQEQWNIVKLIFGGTLISKEHKHYIIVILIDTKS